MEDFNFFDDDGGLPGDSKPPGDSGPSRIAKDRGGGGRGKKCKRGDDSDDGEMVADEGGHGEFSAM